MYASPEAREALREKYGMNDPLIVQYFRWLCPRPAGRLGHVDPAARSGPAAGPGQVLDHAHADRRGKRSSPSSSASASGIVSAVKQGTWIDHTILLVSVFAISMPPYWLGLIAIFVFSVQLHWLPTGGLYSFDGQTSLADSLQHLVMPAVVAGPYARGDHCPRHPLGDARGMQSRLHDRASRQGP